ncbi:RNA polymerase sigma factor (sigma-70 family) [Saccharothrix tamanrassetensis]|uniref:RNA polymerase sigma factor (Sigma-70 family) n=1 Tax=Saccharothrix tamanrassetensis TaxID=1051531 RepID=A0A841CVL5_9PSEU|nr:sigma-70 family RNA polymerase sigma factor [Saccharothrix tamanrassetensis]MBB5960178.1 RNA polymerase sigma factor (sigma-70 family) [Saccharothrix tamanrassetensis]
MGEDNAELLAAAARGDQAAWNELVARYGALLWSVARGFRLSTADCADVVQNTWLRLVENLDRVTEPERLAGWLATTARRECLQLLRRAGRRRESDVPPPEVVDDTPPPDEGLLVAERDRALWRAVDQLSDKCRQLIRTLMTTPPLSYLEVAALLDMPVGSIGPSRSRCLEQLRKLAGEL